MRRFVPCIACGISFGGYPLALHPWRYELRPDFLELKYGIIWRRHVVIPFIRVQNTDTKQGPILRAFGLASVTVSTAAGAMEIPGLQTGEADSVRDRAAEFARLAREDV
ncbi:MAG: PH domain-containing protein [Eggerthellaceae bacterium]|nr:PH domain-containing protein [Eggerthellaceae bacterium]